MVSTLSELVGMTAENLFLDACVRLGYRRVERTHAFVPRTIRKTEQYGKEDMRGVDFVFTLRRTHDGQAQPIIPMQLTLLWDQHPEGSRELRVLGHKQRAHELGHTALFWPVPEFTKKDAMLLFFYASQGDAEALQRFEGLLAGVMVSFLEARKRRIDRTALAILAREVEGEKAQWSVLKKLCAPLAESLIREAEMILECSTSAREHKRLMMLTMRHYRRWWSVATRRARATGLMPPSPAAKAKAARDRDKDKSAQARADRDRDKSVQPKIEIAEPVVEAMPFLLPPRPERPEPIDLVESINFLLGRHKNESEIKQAWRRLDRILPLLSKRARKGIKRVNRSGKPQGRRMVEIRVILGNEISMS